MGAKVHLQPLWKLPGPEFCSSMSVRIRLDGGRWQESQGESVLLPEVTMASKLRIDCLVSTATAGQKCARQISSPGEPYPFVITWPLLQDSTTWVASTADCHTI